MFGSIVNIMATNFESTTQVVNGEESGQVVDVTYHAPLPGSNNIIEDIQDFDKKHPKDAITVLRFLATVSDQDQSGSCVYSPDQTTMHILRQYIKSTPNRMLISMFVTLQQRMLTLRHSKQSVESDNHYKKVRRLIWYLGLGGSLLRQSNDFMKRVRGSISENISYATPGVAIFFCFPNGIPAQISWERGRIHITNLPAIQVSDLTGVPVDEKEKMVFSEQLTFIKRSLNGLVVNWVKWLDDKSSKNQKSHFLSNVRIVSLIWLHNMCYPNRRQALKNYMDENQGDLQNFDIWHESIVQGYRSRIRKESEIINSLRIAWEKLNSEYSQGPWVLDFENISAASIAYFMERLANDKDDVLRDENLLTDAQTLFPNSTRYNLNNGFLKSEHINIATLTGLQQSTNFRWSFPEMHFICLICNALGLWNNFKRQNQKIQSLEGLEKRIFQGEQKFFRNNPGIARPNMRNVSKEEVEEERSKYMSRMPEQSSEQQQVVIADHLINNRFVVDPKTNQYHEKLDLHRANKDIPASTCSIVSLDLGNGNNRKRKSDNVMTKKKKEGTVREILASKRQRRVVAENDPLSPLRQAMKEAGIVPEASDSDLPGMDTEIFENIEGESTTSDPCMDAGQQNDLQNQDIGATASDQQNDLQNHDIGATASDQPNNLQNQGIGTTASDQHIPTPTADLLKIIPFTDKGTIHEKRKTFFENGLQELYRVISTGSEDDIVKKAEELYIIMQDYQLPTHYPGWQQQKISDIDRIAASILPQDLHVNVFPKMVIGDGNCLYRSFSYLVFGDQDHVEEIKFRAIISLLQESQYLLSPKSLNESSLEGIKSLISYSGIEEEGDIDNEKTRMRLIIRLLKEKSGPGQWATFFHVAALSCALQTPVRLIYPHRTIPIHCKERDILNRVIYPKTRLAKKIVNVLWSYSKLPQEGNLRNPNHFVPCFYCSEHLERDQTDIQPVSVDGGVLDDSDEAESDIESISVIAADEYKNDVDEFNVTKSTEDFTGTNNRLSNFSEAANNFLKTPTKQGIPSPSAFQTPSPLKIHSPITSTPLCDKNEITTPLKNKIPQYSKIAAVRNLQSDFDAPEEVQSVYEPLDDEKLRYIQRYVEQSTEINKCENFDEAKQFESNIFKANKSEVNKDEANQVESNQGEPTFVERNQDGTNLVERNLGAAYQVESNQDDAKLVERNQGAANHFKTNQVSHSEPLPLHNTNSDTSNLSQRCEELYCQLEKYQTKNNELSQEKDILSNLLNIANNKIEEENELSQEKNKQIQEMSDEAGKNQSIIADGNHTIENLSRKINEIKAEKQSLETRIREMILDFDHKNALLNELSAQLKNEVTSKLSLQDEVSKLITQGQHLEAENASFIDQCKQKDERNQMLKNELHNHEILNEQLSSKVKQLETECSLLAKKAESNEKEINQTAQIANDSLKTILDEKGELIDRVRILEARCNSLDLDNQSLKVSNENFERENTNLKQHQNSLKSGMTHLESEDQLSKKSLEVLSQQKSLLQKEVTNLKSQYNKLERDNENLNREIRRIKSENNLEQRNFEYDQLEKETNHLKKDLESKEVLLNEWEVKFKESALKLDEVNERNLQLEKQLNVQNQNVSTIKMQLEHEQKSNDLLTKEREISIGDITKMEEEIKCLKQTISNHEEIEDVDSLVRENKDLKQQLKNEEEKQKEMEHRISDEIEKYKEALRILENAVKKVPISQHIKENSNCTENSSNSQLNQIEAQFKAILHAQYLAMLGEVNGGKSALKVQDIYEKYWKELLHQIQTFTINFKKESDSKEQIKHKEEEVQGLKEKHSKLLLENQEKLRSLKSLQSTVDNQCEEISDVRERLRKSRRQVELLGDKNHDLHRKYTAKCVEHECEMDRLSKSVERKDKELEEQSSLLGDAQNALKKEQQLNQNKSRELNVLQEAYNRKCDQYEKQKTLIEQLKSSGIEQPSWESQISSMRDELHQLKNTFLQPSQRKKIGKFRLLVILITKNTNELSSLLSM